MDTEGALHHVMARGLEARDIFVSDKDREDLVNRLTEIAPKTGTSIYAWSLMSNHFHLLLRTGGESISRLMRRILTETGMRRCILVYNCSRTLDDRQVRDHLDTTANNLYGAAKDEYLIGTFRTGTSDAIAAGEALMHIRPVQTDSPDIMTLLGSLDPHQIRERQIQTMLEAFLRHVHKVVRESVIVRDEIELYTAALHLVLGRAVQQSLVSFPLKRIMQRMNDIWLETSPAHLKFFRGVGSLIGKPAKAILENAYG